MPDQSTRPAGGGLARMGVWIIKVLLAAGYLKLSGAPKMVAEFGEIGLGQGFRYVTGGVEVIGTLLLLWPRTAFLGALVLLGICGGALVAQIGVLHGDLVHVFVLGGLVALIAWVSRPKVLSRPA